MYDVDGVKSSCDPLLDQCSTSSNLSSALVHRWSVQFDIMAKTKGDAPIVLVQ